MMQKSTNSPRKLKQKVLLEQLIWKKTAEVQSQLFLVLSINKLKERSSANVIFIPKIVWSKINDMEDTYKFSKMQIQEQENIVETWQYQLQLSYHNKFDNCDNFIQAE